jgi:hypothetical protein
MSGILKFFLLGVIFSGMPLSGIFFLCEYDHEHEHENGKDTDSNRGRDFLLALTL